MTREVHTSRVTRGTKGADSSPATTGVSPRMGLTSSKLAARTCDAVGSSARYRERQECQPARRMGLAVMKKVKEGKEKKGSPRRTRHPLVPSLPPAAPNRLRARKEGRRNGRSKRRRKPRKARHQENAAGRDPSHLRMTRRRERCVQRANEASCS